MNAAILEALANCKLLLAQPTDEVCWSTVSPERLAELHRIAVGLIPEVKRLERIEAAAKELINQMGVVHDAPEYRSVWTMNHIHGGRYNGPTYAAELDALIATLTPSSGD